MNRLRPFRRTMLSAREMHTSGFDLGWTPLTSRSADIKRNASAQACADALQAFPEALTS